MARAVKELVPGVGVGHIGFASLDVNSLGGGVVAHFVALAATFSLPTTPRCKIPGTTPPT